MTDMISLSDRPTLAKAMGAFCGQIGREIGAAPLAEVPFDTLECFKFAFDAEGPYQLAFKLGVLKNKSGEDMAIEFMGLWNRVGYTCY